MKLHIKSILMAFFMLCIFKVDIVSAEDLLNCVYNQGDKEVVVKMDTEYKIVIDDNFVEPYSYKSPTLTVCSEELGEIKHDLLYNHFLDEEAKFICPNEIYVNYNTVSTGGRSGCTKTYTYVVSRSKQEAYTDSTGDASGNLTTKTYSASEIYTKNEERSIVYIESSSDANDASGWLKTCNYGNVVFRFNKQKYEFVSVGSYSNFRIQNENLISELSNNMYGCPVTLCVETVGGRGYYASIGTFYFDNSRNGQNGCITGSEYSNSEFSCVGVSTYYNAFLEAHNNYVESGSTSYLDDRKKNETQLNNFCSTVLSNLDYTDPNNCVKDCLEVQKIIDEKLQSGSLGECGFSEKLIIFIANIIRWVKYIIPVIVIVLGILDFMKAMGADKEDEMKKAQQRFIRRLIAAALIFLVPIIIEFILNKMGFDANGCGIINL